MKVKEMLCEYKKYPANHKSDSQGISLNKAYQAANSTLTRLNNSSSSSGISPTLACSGNR